MISLLPPEVTLTDSIYLASLDPARADLISQQYYMLVNDNATEYNPGLAKQLLTNALNSGLPIDTQIMLWGWSAPMVMQVRENDGYAWVPAYGQPNINIAPGLSMPGVPSNYTTVAPAGSIKVSVDKNDYPPFVSPVTPPPITQITVGPFEISGVGPDNLFHYYYGVNFGDKTPIGTVITDNGQKFVKVDLPGQILGFPGNTMFYQLIPS